LFGHLILALSAIADAGDIYTIDNSHSSVVFRIMHQNISYTQGRFNKISGKLNLDEDTKKSSVQITIEASSIDTNNSMRDIHLRKSEFLDAKNYPEIAFESTSLEKLEGDVLQVNGNLTLHGIRKKISIEMRETGRGKDLWGGYRVGHSSNFTIKRSDFGITHMEKSIGDEVHLMISLESIKK